MSTLGWIFLPALAFAAVVAVALVLAGRVRAGDVVGVAGRPRLRLGSRPLLLAAVLALIFVGLFVAPRLFGFVFLLLPFIWMRGFGRRPPRE